VISFVFGHTFGTTSPHFSLVTGLHTGLIKKADFTSLRLMPVNSTNALLSANVSIVIDQLLGNRSLLEVEQVRLDVDLIYVAEDGDGEAGFLLGGHRESAPFFSETKKAKELVIGRIRTDRAIVPTGQEGALVNITIDNQYLHIEGDQITKNFIEFVVAFIQKPLGKAPHSNGLSLVANSHVLVSCSQPEAGRCNRRNGENSGLSA
jgi:hypothetical protein